MDVNLNEEFGPDHKPLIHSWIEEGAIDVQTQKGQEIILRFLEYPHLLKVPLDLNCRTIYGYSLFNVILHQFKHYDKQTRTFLLKLIDYGADATIECHRLYPLFPLRQKCTLITAFLVHIISLFEQNPDPQIHKDNIQMMRILASYGNISDHDILYCRENNQHKLMYFLLYSKYLTIHKRV
jgi:hypothetical protein